jgi:hypothetical protein
MHTSACHPAANGAVERLVRSFKEIIAKFVNDHPVHWVRAIPQARMAYMSRVHRAIVVSPFEMLHGCTPKLAVPAAFAIGSLAIGEEYDIAEYVDSLQEHFQALDNQALALIEQQFRHNQQDWQRRRSDFSRKSKHDLQVGDLVLEIDDNPDTYCLECSSQRSLQDLAILARGCSCCFGHWRFTV